MRRLLFSSCPLRLWIRILFDHGTPAPLISFLGGHAVTKARDAGWDRISNGELLKLAEEAGFELLLTTDKNLLYQRNLTKRKIAIVVLGNSTWRYVRPFLDHIVLAVNSATCGSYAEVKILLPPKKPFTRS